MKNLFSILACIVVSAVFLSYRVSYPRENHPGAMKLTQWDGLGYYMYLPSAFIYKDFTELKWMDTIDQKYKVTGGQLYQAHIHDNGNYVNKYLGGVAIMQAPLFGIAHVIALNSDYPADGFSPPYQYVLGYGVMIYCLLALLLLRKILLRYYDDKSVAVSILLMFLATNLIQYIPIEGGQSHPYIFPLYVLILYFTIKWHESPKILWASLIGFTIGLATICRPTEAIMLFIPLLWGTQTKEAKKDKWKLVREHRSHVWFTILFGIIGVAPQLIYWKFTAGTWVYDVGSSWRFLTPFFRVIVGWETGWFIYTPITIFFVLGFFFMKGKPYRRSVITFCLLNIWIIISWADWKYGGTYSTRAMVQSFPIFALPFTGIIERVHQSRWKYLFYGLGGYLIFVNFFQVKQFNNTIIHYRDMNRLYYSHIYLDSDPTPLDMSLLDTDEILKDESDYQGDVLFESNERKTINNDVFVETKLTNKKTKWIKIEAEIQCNTAFHESYLVCYVSGKYRKIRLFSPISAPYQMNEYVFYVQLPEKRSDEQIKLFVKSNAPFAGELKQVKVQEFFDH